jgi:EmrB/QacA subfamily drug resistance transporter
MTFVVLAATAASFSLMQSLITPVLPTIQHDLHTSGTAVTLVLTAWLLCASVATPLLGRIGDMIGKDRTLLIALGSIALGCLVAALAPNIGVLIAARVIQGLGSAAFPAAFGIIRDEFPPQRVASAVGVLSAVIATGGGLGVVLAGPIVGALDWRWLFWIPMIVVLAVAALAVRYVPASPIRTPGRVNWLAAVLLSGWLVALLLPLSKAPAWGWAAPATIGLFVLAAALIAGWLAVELRSTNPLIDMRMMRLPAVWTTNLVALLFGAGMFAVYAFLPQLMQTPTASGYGFGASVTTSGLLMLPMLVTMAAGGSLSGPLSTRIAGKTQLIFGSTLTAASSALFALQHDAPWKVATSGAIFGLGLGLVFACLVNLIVQSVPPSQTGVASGMNANIRTIGASIGIAVVSSIITAHTQPTGLPTESGYTTSFLLLAMVGAAATALAILVPTPRQAPQTVTVPAELVPELTPAEV